MTDGEKHDPEKHTPLKIITAPLHKNPRMRKSQGC